MKRVWLIFMLVILASFAQASSTLAGTIKYPDGTGFTGLLQIQMVKKSVVNTCDSNRIVPTDATLIRIVNGVIQGSYSFPETECLSPRIPYYAELYTSDRLLVLQDNFYMMGATFDLGSVTHVMYASPPVTVSLPSPVIKTPTTTQTIVQPGGTSFAITGNASVSGTFSPATLALGTVTGSGTFSSLQTFTTGLTLTNAGIFDQTSQHEYIQSLINGCSPSTEWNATQGTRAIDGLAGCVAAPVSSTAESNAVAGYANSLSGAPAVGGFFQGRALANGATVWGLNAVVQDIAGLTTVGLIGIDINVNPQNGPSAYPVTAGGVNVALAAPNAGVYGNAYTCQKFGANLGTWAYCYISADKATDQAFVVGTHTGSNPQGSQQVIFHHTDAGGVTRESRQSLDSGGNFIFAPFGGSVGITGGLNLTGALDTTGATLRTDGSGRSAIVSDGSAIRSGTVGGTYYLDLGTLTIRDGNGATSGGHLVVSKTVTINGGVIGDGGGLKHKRIASTAATAASVGAVIGETVTWGTTFADANYTVECFGDLVTSGVPLNGGITAKSASSVTFQTVAATAVAARYTTIDCTAHHD